MNLKMPKFKSVLSSATRGGNRRFLLLGASAVTVIAIVLGVSHHKVKEMPKSNPGHIVEMNALPGGTNTTPLQDTLRGEQNTEDAHKAEDHGVSYTPDIAPAVLRNTRGQHTDAVLPDDGQQAAPAAPQEVGYSAPIPPPAPPPVPPHIETAAAVQTIPTDPAYAQGGGETSQADQQARDKRRARYVAEIARIEDGLQTRMPVTALQDSVFKVAEENEAKPSSAPANGSAGVSVAARSAHDTTTVPALVPAGRGVYAHTVTATDSDLTGQIVLEADSGPIAGDRMIASVTRAPGNEQLLVLQVTKIVHQGRTLATNGVVMAPDSMKQGVASSVDPLIFQRFVMPAAAAFVQGLGQAIETTSNVTGSYSALGGMNYIQKLNLGQQMGVAAGSAASAINNALTQDMPTRSRINLAAGVNVGVMFMDPVVDKT
ncbi:type IV secretion protein DotG [Gluconobacter albidus]|uniref:Type IV secretion protein DotG n=1 Tax=Gluconobacter albidus TaxID=318683 RepID=A0A149TM18_9PROT|nr:DotG/IcmE/VirB10 family protein [Gluconobacter albidus]KXV49949.1 type IV secretion protein DotG [Gluconobacter albidus]